MSRRKRQLFEKFKGAGIRKPTRVTEEDFDIEELRNKYDKNKSFDKGIELPALVALSGYPELKDVKIDFRFFSVFMIMISRPRLNFIFRKRKNRKYVVYVNTTRFLFKGLLFDDLTFNAKVGAFAHELAHTTDYLKMSNLEIMLFSLRYLVKWFRKKIEWQTDIEAINRGFGYQIFEFTRSLLNNPKASRRYKRIKKKNYLTDDDIKHYIRLAYDEDIRWT